MAAAGARPGVASRPVTCCLIHEAQQYGLGLIVEGVTDQHRGRTRPGLGVEGAVASLSGCRFGPGGRRLVDLNRCDSHIVVAKPGELLLDARGNIA